MVFAFKCSANIELASSRVLLLKFRYVVYVQTTQLKSMPMQDATMMMVLAADVHTYMHVCPKSNAYMSRRTLLQILNRCQVRARNGVT